MNLDRRLAELADLHFDQRLDDESRNELESMLLADAGCRRAFWQRAETEGLLREWGRAQEGVDMADRGGMTTARPGGWRSRWLAKTAAIAAVIALAASFWIYQTSRTGQPQRHNETRSNGVTLPDHWLATSKRQNQRPDLLIRYTFDDISPDYLRVPNQAALTGAGLDGTIGGATICDGRWPTKKALEFDRRFDGVRVTVPGVYQNVTMAAWIQVSGLDHKFNGLLLSDGIKAGGFHWQIMDSGALNVGLTDRVPGFPVYISPPVITPDTFGKWLFVAVTCDSQAKTLSHYLNGKVVSRHSLDGPVQLRMNSVMIGNWDPAGDIDADMIRNFRGRIDDIAIYRAPLSGEEIENLYDQGRN